MPIHPAAELVRLSATQQRCGISKVPSIFIKDYWVTGPEQCLEEWLYRNGFRPADEHYLGLTETWDGLDADTLNAYFHDENGGFSSHRVEPPSRKSWTWGNVAVYASKIKSIKRFIKKEQHGT